MKKTLFQLLALVGAIGLIVSIVMLVSAIKFGEIGRVIAYFVLGVLCLELAVWAASKHRNTQRK